MGEQQITYIQLLITVGKKWAGKQKLSGGGGIKTSSIHTDIKNNTEKIIKVERAHKQLSIYKNTTTRI